MPPFRNDSGDHRKKGLLRVKTISWAVNGKRKVPNAAAMLPCELDRFATEILNPLISKVSQRSDANKKDRPGGHHPPCLTKNGIPHANRGCKADGVGNRFICPIKLISVLQNY